MKPRWANGSHTRASSATTRKSAAAARCRPMPATQPRAATTTGTCVVHTAGMSRWAWVGSRRWIDPTRGRGAPSALRPTMSNPQQK